MPSKRIRVRAPGWESTSRSSRASAEGLVSVPAVIRLLVMPALSTPVPGRQAFSRADSRSGQRWFVSAVEKEPSVIESPSATTDPAPGAVTSTPLRKGQLVVVQV